MTDGAALILALLAGVLLGAVFFGGLWWTVKKTVSSDTPARWFLGSLLVRTSLILTGFYFIAHGHWQRLLACLIGFVIARVVLVKRLATSPANEQARAEKEAGNAAA